MSCQLLKTGLQLKQPLLAKKEAKPTHRDPILDRIPRNVRDENCASWSGKGAYNQFQTAAIVNSLPDGGPRSIGASSAKSVPEFLNSTSDSVDVDRSHDNLSDLNSSSAESALLPSFSSPAADDPTVDELRDLGNSDNTCQAGNGAKPTPVKKLNGIAGSNALSRSDEVLVCQADCQGRFGGYVNQHGMRNGGGGGGGGVGCNGSVFALDADARCSPPSSNDLNETASSTATSKSGLRVRIPQADACFDNHCCPSDKCARASSRASCGSSSTGSSIAGVAGSNCCSPHSFCGWGTPSPPERAESVLPCEEENLRGAPWFQAGIPREIALEVLNEEPEGAFLVRESTTKKGCFALSLRVPKHFQPSGIAHYLIMRTQRGYKIKGFMKEFPCLTSLITHHSVMPELLPCPLSLARYNPSFTKTDSSKDFAEIDTDPDYNTLSDFKRIALEADN
ncbi:unnamed protein product [Notodromas monacha]|uniref:SH2 domain-containing protein n=1 Tax=Notodromas monacha TaxID=399045 RepID=A0A7R9BHY1_9CRUS|nr:unnamed protein product [Notodromas monacha]CAG0914448.1 unnamed protein product [Notodromas monacha]